jgi:hypothetical protein
MALPRLCIFPVVLLIGLATTADTTHGQLDRLRQAIKKATAATKKTVECAVNDDACIAKAKSTGTPVKTVPATPSAAADVASLDAAVSSAALAPTGTPSFGITVSDDGSRAAGVAMKGSRYVVVIDGQESELFDQVEGQFPQGHPSAGKQAVDFSPGGKRYAYVAQRGGLLAVVDGKELGPYHAIEHSTFGGRRASPFHFSDDGAHVAFIVSEKREIGKPGSQQVVLDGVPGPRFERIDTRGGSSIVSAGGRMAYVGVRNQKSHHIVIDGKEGPAYDSIMGLRGNKDGHVAFIASRGSSWFQVVDGVEGKVHQGPAEEVHVTTTEHLLLAPAGKSVAYIVRRRLDKPRVDGRQVVEHEHDLVVDGKVVATAQYFNGKVFSPDGKRVAAVGKKDNGWALMMDGTTSQVYQEISDVQFSPDSKRIAFVGKNGVRSFAVVDGKELPTPFVKIEHFRFSADSRRYAFEAFKNPARAVVVDGTVGPDLREIVENSLTFSPDGSRYAYAGSVKYMDGRLVVDGKEQSVNVGTFQPRSGSGVKYPALVFSPDGQRLAYVSNLLDGKGGRSVMVDGKAGPTGNLFTAPVFSPDGTHFAYAAWYNQKWMLVVDGKASPIEGELLETNRTLAFQSDGSLRYLAVKDGMVHRFVVKLRSGTN